MSHRTELLGFGLLLTLGVAGCGTPSPVTPSLAVAPSPGGGTPQEVAAASEDSVSGAYQVQQYYRDTGGMMPTYQPRVRRGPVFGPYVPYRGRGESAAAAIARMRRDETYRMARWMAARDITINAAIEYSRLSTLLRMRPDSRNVDRWRARQAELESRMRQMRMEMYYGPQY